MAVYYPLVNQSVRVWQSSSMCWCRDF